MSVPGTQSVAAAPDWTRILSQSLEKNGVWATYEKLQEYARRQPGDLTIRGYLEILRTMIVRELIDATGGLAAVPRLSSDFLSDFERFDLQVQEGFLVSQIDGRLSLDSLLKLSPFDTFTTLFNLAKLRHEGAIEISK